jgi:LAO/AO transport system kinase
LHFFRGSPSGWTPRAFACSAHSGRGIPDLWNRVLEHSAITRANGWFDRNRREQRRRWMQESIEQGLGQLFSTHLLVRARREALEADVIAGRTTPFRAARALLEMYAGPGQNR